MKQFNLSEYLKNPNRKLVTRDGRPARILDYNLKGYKTICVAVDDKTQESVITVDEVGHSLRDEYRWHESKFDLFFADDEEQPQSIEIPFGSKDSEFIRDEYFIPDGCEARIEGNKVIIEKVQKDELTKFEKAIYQYICIFVNACEGEIPDDKELKPIVKGIAKDLRDLAINEFEKEDWRTPLRTYKNGYEQCKQDVLKRLPKWKKDSFHSNPSVVDGRLYYHGYYIDIYDLEILSKEE